ncbi:hypothetical protein T03_1444 [Trichinella britovi]|uniref:Uncharacterized protein n=1 Tax=Trichinella britovi TaxID=45882 RepID=A0A0V0YUA9_TRIBR|nr:hypothetical protein T03_1444 [Trichinella britovi]
MQKWVGWGAGHKEGIGDFWESISNRELPSSMSFI